MYPQFPVKYKGKQKEGPGGQAPGQPPVDDYADYYEWPSEPHPALPDIPKSMTQKSVRDYYNPPYQWTYWENPANVARAYWQYRSTPPDQLPDWMDPEALEEAYNYFDYSNRQDQGDGTSWTQWKWLNTDDPARQFLQSMQLPSPDYLLPKRDYYEWVAWDELQKPPEQRDVGKISKLPLAYQYMFQNLEGSPAGWPQEQAEGQVPYAPSPEMTPTWQQAYSWLQTSPAGSIVRGAAMGAPNPFGILMGAGLGAASYLPEGGFKDWAMGALQKLDYPAEWIEKAMGSVQQIGASILNPEEYGTLQEVLSDPRALWESSTLADTTMARTQLIAGINPFANLPYQQDISYGLLNLLGVDTSPMEAMQQLDPLNAAAGLEYIIRDLTNNHPEIIKFTEENEVWQPRQDEEGNLFYVPNNVPYMGQAALTDIRRRIARGENVQEVIEDVTRMFGESGAATELAMHVVLDPLNFAGMGVGKVGKTIGKVTGNEALRNAYRTWGAPVEGMRRYRDAIRAGLAGAPDDLTRFQRALAGITEDGMIKEFITDPKVNPLKKAGMNFLGLTPSAKARGYLNLTEKNVMGLADIHRGNVDDFVQSFSDVANQTPRQASNIGRFLESPLMYTGQRALANYLPTLQKKYSIWQANEGNRALLQRWATATGTEPAALLEILGDGKNIDAAWNQLTEKARASGLDPQLIADIDNGRIRAESLQNLAELFNGKNAVPWNPDWFMGDVLKDFATTTGKLTGEIFGVKPDAPFFRLVNGVAKSAMSLFFLNLNPKYLYNNITNDLITRQAAGVGGMPSKAQISRWIDDFGMEPPRMRAGVGMAGGLDELDFRDVMGQEFVGQPFGRVGGHAGELEVRGLATEKRGAIAAMQRRMDKISKIGFIGKMAGKFEQAESARATYIGMRKSWESLSNRNGIYRQMPKAVIDALTQIDPRLPNYIWAAVEGNMKPAEIRKAVRTLAQGTLEYKLGSVINDVANDLGMDIQTVRDNLGPIWDDLDAAIQKAKSADEIDEVFRRVETDFQNRVDGMNVDDIRNRAEQVAARVQVGGVHSALQLFDEIKIKITESIAEHFQRWDEFWLADDERRAAGVEGGVRNRLFRSMYEAERGEYLRIKDQHRAMLEGYMNGMKLNSEFSRAYVAAAMKSYDLYNNFFDVKSKRIAEHYSKISDPTYARDAGWQAILDDLDRLDRQINSELRTNNRFMNDLFVEQMARQYGVEAGLAARNWRNDIQAIEEQMAEMRRVYRAEMRATDDIAARRARSQEFYNNEYMAALREYHRLDIEGNNDIRRTIIGKPPNRVPPEEAAPQPQAAQQAPDIAELLTPNEEISRALQAEDYNAAWDYILSRTDEQEIAQIIQQFPYLEPRLAEARRISRAIGEGRLSDLPPGARAEIEGELQSMSGLVSLGEPGKRITKGYRTGEDTGEFTSIASTYPTWYGMEGAQLHKGSYKGLRGKSAVIQAIDDLVKGDYEKLSALQAKILDIAYGNLFDADYQAALAGAPIESASRVSPQLHRALGFDVPEYPSVPSLRQIMGSKANLEARADGRIIRQQVSDMVGGDDHIMRIFDARAAIWAEANGRALEEWYTANLAGDKTLNIANDLFLKEGGYPEPVSSKGLFDWLEEDQKVYDALKRISPEGLTGDDLVLFNRAFDNNMAVEPPLAPRAEAPEAQVAPEVEQAASSSMPQDIVDVEAPQAYMAELLGDAWSNRTRPVLDAVQDKLKHGDWTPPGKVPQEVMDFVESEWLNGVLNDDLPMAKRISMDWGEAARDSALLNYSNQRGFDKWLNLGFPYQYWFTRTMVNWMQRILDKPAWFANYARMKEWSDRYQDEHLPSRMRGKIRMPAPWLPDWAGNSIFVDPLGVIFPFDQIMNSADRVYNETNRQEQRAEWLVQRWIGMGQASQSEAMSALASHEGALWERAMAQSSETDDLSGLDFLSMFMSPSPLITYPYYAATGKPLGGGNDLSLLPLTRTGYGLKAATQDTALQPIGDILGAALTLPETVLRQKFGLQEFGNYGDYYIERQLANMAAEGIISPDRAQIAMVERTGPEWDEARQRVMYEIGMKTGAGAVQAQIKTPPWKDPLGWIAGTLFGSLPANLLPDGELEQRGLKEVYDMAWKQYNLGDETAINEFFEEHPEYNARLALWDEPEERLRNLMISEVWDAYSELGTLEKQQAREQLGEEFERYFLDNETRNYDSININTLTNWAGSLGGYVPRGESVEEIIDPDIDPQQLSFAPPEEAQIVDTYRDIRNSNFPNWYAVQSLYFSYPEKSAERKQVLAEFPWLKDYWEWSRSYKDNYPAIEKYVTQPTDTVPQMDMSWVQELTTGTLRQLFSYYQSDTPLTAGSLKELQMTWKSLGSPNGTFENWLEETGRVIIAP